MSNIVNNGACQNVRFRLAGKRQKVPQLENRRFSRKMALPVRKIPQNDGENFIVKKINKFLKKNWNFRHFFGIITGPNCPVH